MKIKLTGLSQRHVAAPRKCLKTGPGGSLPPVLRPGREAVVPGLETLEPARTHEAAVLALELSKSKNSQIDQVRSVFTEAMVPIVQTHRSAPQGRIQLNQRKESLNQRMAELTSTNRQSHRVLEGQEAQRKAISQESRDEIARTLAGVNVRPLTLKREVRNNTRGFKNEIANTRRLVVKSALSVRQVERKIRCP
jgi:signal transduction histidine kinase